MKDRLDGESEELSNACYTLLYDSFIDKKYELTDQTASKITRFCLTFNYSLDDAQKWIKTYDEHSPFMNFIILYEARARGNYKFSPEELSRFRAVRKQLHDSFSMTESRSLKILQMYL